MPVYSNQNPINDESGVPNIIEYFVQDQTTNTFDEMVIQIFQQLLY